MKLNKKHFAEYLPYDLMVNRNNVDGYNLKLVGVDNIGIRLLRKSGNTTLCSRWKHIDENKPILNNISNLLDSFNGVDIIDNFIGIERKQVMNLVYLKDQGLDYLVEIPYLTHIVYHKLILNHVDVFGLIESGLAIDKKALEKEKQDTPEPLEETKP